jgi:peptidoglycan/LPS O-acetylase OafA/YrhL
MPTRTGSAEQTPDSIAGGDAIAPGARRRWWRDGAPWRGDRTTTGAPSPSSGRFYPGLDLLRGIAAVTVVIYHVIAWFEWKSFPDSNPVALWCRLGWMGVDLFFVISGFVIAMSAFNLLEREPANYAREYCRRRLSRIVPLHYLTCLIYVLFITPSLMFHEKFYAHALTHLSFTHSVFWQTMGSIDGPNWSLSVEMQFYLLILLSAPLLRKIRPTTMLAMCVAIAWGWRAMIFARFHGDFRSGVNMTWFGASQLPGSLDEFGMGILLAMLFHRDRDGRLHGLLHRTRYLWPVAAALLGVLTMKLFWRYNPYWDNWKLVVFWRTLLAANFLLVVISACMLDDSWFLKLTAPVRYLGTVSYGIYLWHMLIVFSLKPLLMGDPLRACKWSLGLSIFLAMLSWHLFEKPVLERYGRRKKDKKAPGSEPNHGSQSESTRRPVLESA